MAYLETSPSIYKLEQSKSKCWVASGSKRLPDRRSQTQLLFTEVPSSSGNRVTRVGLPAPIVIERLLPVPEAPEDDERPRSSITFTAVSEERLQAAVKLAQRDLRRGFLDLQPKAFSGVSQEASQFETSEVEDRQAKVRTQTRTKLKPPNPTKNVCPPTEKRQAAKTNPASLLPRAGMSPPTRDTEGPRPMEGGKDASLRCEIRRLQSELELYIQKVKESTATLRGWKTEEPLEPEEQHKLEIHQQQQAARSARIIYVLQRQVKDIHEEAEKLPNSKMWDSKKASTISKLAAAYRASRRALQQIIHPFLHPPRAKVPSHYREISQVIRQLSLCSGKVEADQGSAVPLMTINVLEKLETLDSALSEQEMLSKVQAQTCPSNRKSPVSSPRKGNYGKRLAMRTRSRKNPSNLPMSRGEVLRNGLIRLAQQRELKELQNNNKNRKTVHTKKPKAGRVKFNPTTNSGFQQPTVSSRLRVNQLPEKEHAVPWIPTSPYSAHPHRSPERGREEPRCAFSPVKASPSSPKQGVVVSGLGTQPLLSSGKKQEARNEALREARLDKMTMQRLGDPNQLNKEEAEHIQRIRFEGVSPMHWAEEYEQEARERISPFLEEQLTEVLVENLLEDASQAAWAVETDRRFEVRAQRRLQAPTLESMLLRMEEIQRDQEEVRRRFASINYSDPFYRDRAGVAGSQLSAPDNPPASPQPVRLTKPALTRPSGADIFLEKPVETGHSLLSESSLAEEQQHTHNVPPESVQGNTVISVSNSLLRNIRRYREDYDSYLRALALKDVSRLNPWAVAERYHWKDIMLDIYCHFKARMQKRKLIAFLGFNFLFQEQNGALQSYGEKWERYRTFSLSNHPKPSQSSSFHS
ncbi:protein moonraker isoform X2 [Gouania willdenowi]|uniref:protein moonraker isoform X2 n=1 Tax=Gouania willdenowi TaxID=441366 RepID=UPI001054BDDB|nr:protein moonraker isoform X2 [Gouania willdenowi]